MTRKELIDCAKKCADNVLCNCGTCPYLDNGCNNELLLDLVRELEASQKATYPTTTQEDDFAKTEAKYIFRDYTANRIAESHVINNDAREVFNSTTRGCAVILTKWFMEGKYTPMEYNAITDALFDLLHEMFCEVFK